MRQQSAAMLLMVVALASTLVLPIAGLQLRSRFLAGLGPKNKKCTEDRTVCLYFNSSASTCCGDSCMDTQTDLLNCRPTRSTGKICKFTDSCCGGKCVELSYDEHNCGSCGNKRCFYGMWA